MLAGFSRCLKQRPPTQAARTDRSRIPFFVRRHAVAAAPAVKPCRHLHSTERHRAMWPFNKKKEAPPSAPPGQISYSQVDITERFGDNLSLTADDWISTSPLNSTAPNAQSMGLPPVDAGDAEVYRIAERLSRLREWVPIPDAACGRRRRSFLNNAATARSLAAKATGACDRLVCRAASLACSWRERRSACRSRSIGGTVLGIGSGLTESGRVGLSIRRSPVRRHRHS